MTNTDPALAGVKGILSSKTFWSAAVGILATGYGAYTHHVVSPADQSTFVNIATEVVETLSGLGAIYGRISATQKIG
jgi:hypothetical protein